MADVDLYLVRVWRRVGAVWCFRAAVQPLDHSAVQVFGDPDQLKRYLEDRSVASPTSSPGSVEPGRPATGEGQDHGAWSNADAVKDGL